MGEGASVRRSSVLATFDIIGDRWMLLLLDELFSGVETWSELAERLQVSPSTLSKRLGQLTEAGCIEKHPGAGRSAAYRLTDKGKALFPILAASDEWRLNWDNPDLTAAPRWVHRCGQPLRSRSVCGCCDLDLSIADVEYRAGPGAGPAEGRSGRHFRNSQSGVADWKEGEERGSRYLQVMGDRRAAQLLAAFYQGCHRFDEFEAMTGLHPAIVSDRLRKFQLLGLAHTRLYQERPDRYVYSLSTPGRALYPITVQLMHWGDRWVFGPGREPLLLLHKPCGERLQGVVKCRHCALPVQYADVTPRETRSS